ASAAPKAEAALPQAAAATTVSAATVSAAPAVAASEAPAKTAITVTTDAQQPKVRPRPYKRRGYTVSKATPSGTAHITMNEDEESQPFEVFLEIGKAGSDIKAM